MRLCKYLEPCIYDLLHSPIKKIIGLVILMVSLVISVWLVTSTVVKVKLLPKPLADNFTIYVDLPNNGNKLLVHGYTGAYDKVSHGVANYLRSLESVYPPQPLYGEWSPNAPITGEIVPPSEEAIKVLKRRGYLT